MRNRKPPWSGASTRGCFPEPLRGVLIACALLAGCSHHEDATGVARPQMREFNWPVMGTYANLILADGFDSSNAVEIAKAKLEEVNAALSVFVPTSDVARLNAAGSISFTHVESSKNEAEVSGHMLNVADASCDFYRVSNGAFNTLITPLVELWGFYRGGERHDFPPSEETVANTLLRCDFQMFVPAAAGCIDDDGVVKTTYVMILDPGARIDFGGIAKGYAVDVVYNSLREAGCTNFLMNLGGNMRASGTNEWKIAVRNPLKGVNDKPLETIALTNGLAISTSGGYEQFSEKDGIRYCHIIDPRTGCPVQGMEQVTVISPEAMAADALSTAAFVLGAEDSKEMLSKYGASAVFVFKDVKGKLRIERVGDFW